MRGVSGGLVPVEGSTSLLDVGLKAGILALGPTIDPLRCAGWLGLAWLIALLGVTSVVAHRWTGSARLAALVTATVALSPGLVESAGYLLEGPLFALVWVLALVAAREARPWRAAFWSLFVAAARPEGLALAPVVVLWAGRQTHRGGSQEERFGQAPTQPTGFPWRWLLVGLGASLLVTAVRWWKFGELVPNTYYAKASDSILAEVQDGALYIRSVVWGADGLRLPSVSVGLALALGALRAWTLSESGQVGSVRRSARGLLGFSLLYAALVVISGGDSYEGARLFMPIALPIWLALAAGHSPPGEGAPNANAERPSPRALASFAALLIALLVGVVGARGLEMWKTPVQLASSTGEALVRGPVGLEAFDGDADVFRSVAIALGEDGVFAHVHTQRFRWFEPRVPVLDLTGLTDKRIARLPMGGSVRFGRMALRVALEQRAGAIHLDPERARPTSIVDAGGLVAALSDPAVAGRYIGEPFIDPALAAELAGEYVGASRTMPGGQGIFNLLIHRSRIEAFRREGFRVAVGR